MYKNCGQNKTQWKVNKEKARKNRHRNVMQLNSLYIFHPSKEDTL